MRRFRYVAPLTRVTRSVHTLFVMPSASRPPERFLAHGPDRGRALVPAVPRLLLALAILVGGWALAQSEGGGSAWLVVPAQKAVVSSDVVRLHVGGAETSYVAGLGWSSGWTLPAPTVREDGRVLIAPEVAEALDVPYLAGVRTGLDGATTRLVLDLPGAPEEALEPLRHRGTVGPAAPTTFRLPGVLVPDGVLLTRDGLIVRSVPADEDGPARVVLQAPEAQADVFPLTGPARLVVDLAPEGVPSAAAALGSDAAPRAAPAPLAPIPEGRVPEVPVPDDRVPEDPVQGDPVAVASGVSYRRMHAPGTDGASTVHVVELDPRLTELRVVGRSGEGRPVAAWADGGVAAINAGYFDPGSFEAIGLRRIGGTLLSLPSRGRAAVGFGPTGTTVARADARVRVRVDGRVTVDRVMGSGDELSLSRAEGRAVGTPRRGVVTVGRDGRVRSNTIGPAEVPTGGFALVYDASIRPLALLDPGRRVSVGVTLEPNGLERSGWVVEAGPLLVQDGRPAFEPEHEGFARGARILDEATQQAALGVRADGTVLFVVAERMIAEDLVPLFLDLGAEAALRLDSGSSATLVAGGRTVNRILSRPVESAIVAVPVADAGATR